MTDHSQQLVELAVAIVPQIERSWGCIVEMDKEVLAEAAARALVTIEQIGVTNPNQIRQAAHFAFWIKKLKPLRVIDPYEFAHVATELIRLGILSGQVAESQTVIPPPRRRYVNEVFAILTAIGIARHGGYLVRMPKHAVSDLAVSFRYRSISPSAIGLVLSAHAGAPSVPVG